MYIAFLTVDYLIPKKELVFTVLWSKVEVEASLKRRKHCFLKYSTGRDKSGKWVKKKIHFDACKNLESGKTYKVFRSVIMKSWFVDSITEVNN